MWQLDLKSKNRDKERRHDHKFPLRTKKKFLNKMKGRVKLTEEDALRLGIDIESDCVCIPRKICSRRMKKIGTLGGNPIKEI